MTDRNGRTPDHPDHDKRSDPDTGPPRPGYVWLADFGVWGTPSAADRFGGDMGLGLRGSSECFYINEHGEKDDAEIHDEILKDGPKPGEPW